LTNSIRYLSHKAQVQGLSGDERELLKAQLLALEFYIARTNAPHTQPLATTTSISDNRPSSPPDLASVASADRHWHHLPDIRDHHLGVSVTSQHKKRAKRTFNRACVHCGTQFTSQWRKGPAGASTYVAALHLLRSTFRDHDLTLGFISGCAMRAASAMPGALRRTPRPLPAQRPSRAKTPASAPRSTPSSIELLNHRCVSLA
jgi:hypothetical protein